MWSMLCHWQRAHVLVTACGSVSSWPWRSKVMLMLAKAPSSPGLSRYLKGCSFFPFKGVVVAVSLDDSESVDDKNDYDDTHLLSFPEEETHELTGKIVLSSFEIHEVPAVDDDEESRFSACRELGTCCWSLFATEARVVQHGVLAYVAVKKACKAVLWLAFVGVLECLLN